MGVIMTVIVRALVYGAILFVFISPVPAWMMMMGGANRMVKKTKGSLNAKGIRNIGRANMNKVKNYFKNGGGQGQFDLPDEGSFYSDDINENEYMYNPTEAIPKGKGIEDEYMYNPILAEEKEQEDIFAGVERVDKMEEEGVPIKVSKSKTDKDVKDDFFSDTFWDMEIKK